jgi:hypothetical protein
MTPTDRALDDLHDEMQIIAVARELRNIPLNHHDVEYAWAVAVRAGRLTESQVKQFGKAAIEREELRQRARWDRIQRAFG